MTVRAIPNDQIDPVIDTIHEAFIEYPVMRYVLGPNARDFDRKHRELIRLFVSARAWSGEHLFGIGNESELEAAAVASMPGITVPPRASMTSAPGGMSTSAPTSLMRPSLIRTVPFSIVFSARVRMRALRIASGRAVCATAFAAPTTANRLWRQSETINLTLF